MKKRCFSILLALLLCSGVLLAGCTEGGGGGAGSGSIDFYSGDELDVNGDMRINEELFFRNGLKGVSADPHVFDNTERDGYYYIVSTDGPAYMYRSKNMMDIEPVGPAVWSKTEDDKAVVNVTPFWAPEIVYDEDTELYYLFFSTYGQATAYDGEAGLVSNTTAVQRQVLFVATSETARGPYYLVNMDNLEHAESYRNVCKTPGTPLTDEEMPYGVDENGVAQRVTEDNIDELYRFAYPDDKIPYAKYGYFSQEEYVKYLSKYESAEYNETIQAAESGSAGYTSTIDAHPFVDENGDKWLYWTENDDQNNIYCCPMYHNNWLYPDLSQAKPVICSYYYTVEDYLNAQEVAKFEDTLYAVCTEYEYNEDEGKYICSEAGTAGHEDHAPQALPEGVTYKTERTDDKDAYGFMDSHVNEGAAVIYHNGKYYMTFSTGAYRDNTYRVMQAVSDKPNEGWRKLRPEEGGVLLSGSDSGSKEVTGTGHNSLITIGDQLFIYYHTHDDTSIMDTQRHGNIDELKWVTIKDKDGDDLDVLYANGPLGVPQPRIEKYAEYKNIADEAESVKVTSGALVSGSSVDALTDGYLSVLREGSAAGTSEFADTYIKETLISKTSTFTFDFAEGRTVRAVLVYTSKNADDIFYNVSKMEFIGTDKDGNKVTHTITGIALSETFYEYIPQLDLLDYVNVGAFAFAEFYELENITSVRVTVEKPEGQERAGISEIRILGK